MEKKEHQKHKATHVKIDESPKRKESGKSLKQKISHIYTKKYKTLMIIPNILLLLSFIVLFFNFFSTGEFVQKGVSLSGGVSMTISSSTISSVDVQDYLKSKYPKSDVESRTLSGAGEQMGIIVEASGIDSDVLQNDISSKYGLSKNDYTVEVTGSSLGKSFYKQLIIAIIVAFILMGIVVYAYYRLIIPSLAIILAAFSSMITTLAVISLMGIKITPASIAAFLMLIGYSIDTDILLTTRVLKRKEGSVDERVFSAIKTGITMTSTAIVAVAISLIFTHSEVLKQIMVVLLIGLIFDLVYTWIQNVGLLKLYLEKKGELKNE